ncbi:MAG: PEP-CTERM system TPR-repeat protein PrsT, partial [Pseudomonadota bacterium]|nr:PEP-CTERM system TPR-repeat protein PrsT [Pseudomonadota bacterium]
MQLKTKIALIASLGAGAVAAAFIISQAPESNAVLRAQARQYQDKSELPAAVITLKNAIEATPSDAEARYLLAKVYIEQGDGVSAEKEIRMALQHGYSPVAALPLLGESLQLQGQFQKVLDETAAGGDGADLLCVRAAALLALGKIDSAKQVYGAVLQGRPKFAAALTGLGRAAFLERDIEGANRYAALARAAEPRNTDVLMFKGDLLRAENQPTAALAAYDQVLALRPAHRSAHIEKAYLEISLGKFAEAQADLDIAREASPASVLVFYTQALLDYSQGKNSEALESMQNVLRVAPDHMPSVLLAAAIDLNIGALHQAERHLRHYLEKNPDNIYARKMLASTLLRSGHSPDALIALAPALAIARQDVQLLALAGESYMQARDFNNAAAYFDQASTLDPKAAGLRTSLAMSKLGKGDNEAAIRDLQLASRLDSKSPRAGIALVRTELGLGHLDQAYAAAEALEKSQPGNAAVHDLKGMVWVSRHNAANARASFRKALALQPSYFLAAANLAQLDLNDKHPDAAEGVLRAFLEKNPASVEAMTTLATLATSEHKTEETTQWLERASAAEPNAIAPAVNLLAQYLETGKNDKALNLAQKLQVTHFDNPDLLDLLGKSQLANGEQENALSTYKKLAVALPRSAPAQMQVAALQLLLKHPNAAEDALKVALAIQPDFPAAQLALAELHVRRGWHELALQIAANMQRRHPRAAAGFQLEGDILMAQNKPALALPAFEQAFAFTRSSELAIKTANAMRAAGQQEPAAKRLAQWLR